MEKLELKDIAMYLPYGLKLAFDTKHFPIIPEEMIGFNGSDVLTEQGDYNLCDIKPILRPLSDLAKEIEVDGKKFVPVDELEKTNYEINVIYENGNLFFEDECDLNYFSLTETSKLINKLISWHFDINGLIEKDLAIKI